MLSTVKKSKLILCGDYNIREARWDSDIDSVNMVNLNIAPVTILTKYFGFSGLFKGRYLDLMFSYFENLTFMESRLFSSSINHMLLEVTFTSDNFKLLMCDEIIYDLKTH